MRANNNLDKNMTDQDKTDKFMNYFDKIIGLLRSHTGNDFSSYKKTLYNVGLSCVWVSIKLRI